MAFAIIDQEHVRRAVIGEVNVRCAVQVIIERGHGHRPLALHFDARAFAHILKSSAAQVPIQAVMFRGIRQWPGVGALRVKSGFEIRVVGEVIRNKQIQQSVAVDIQEHRANARSGLIRYARLLRHILEGAVAAIPIQNGFPDIDHIQVRVAVVIEVRRAHPGPISKTGNAGFLGHVLKRAVFQIVIEPVGLTLCARCVMRHLVERAGVHQV